MVGTGRMVFRVGWFNWSTGVRCVGVRERGVMGRVGLRSRMWVGGMFVFGIGVGIRIRLRVSFWISFGVFGVITVRVSAWMMIQMINWMRIQIVYWTRIQVRSCLALWKDGMRFWRMGWDWRDPRIGYRSVSMWRRSRSKVWSRSTKSVDTTVSLFNGFKQKRRMGVFKSGVKSFSRVGENFILNLWTRKSICRVNSEEFKSQGREVKLSWGWLERV